MAKKQMSAFEKALTDAALSRYETELAGSPEELTPSAAFRQSVDALTKKAERRSWRYVNTAKKRLLVALIALLVLAATACAAIPALREGLIRLFVHDSGIAYSFGFSEEDLARAPEEIETPRKLGWVPEGLELLNDYMSQGLIEQMYSYSGKVVLQYMQMPIWATDPEVAKKGIPTGLTIDSEGAKTETLVIDGYEVLAIHTGPEKTKDPTDYLWTDHSYLYSLFVSDKTLIDEQMVVRMVKETMKEP